MNLVSKQFILFMIITTILYYISPKKLKKYTLLIISVVMLSFLGFENIIYILFSTFISYLAGLGIQKRKNKKAILFTTIGINSFILIVMKLVPYITQISQFKEINLLVPLGISYYTFQIISYIIDVYREKYEPEKNFFKFALYVMYIPYLFVGPISRFDEVKQSLIEQEDKKFNLGSLYKGVLQIALGFFKKLVIVSRVQIVITTIVGDMSTYTGAYALLAMLLYSIEIYSDFSGAIDIVLGFSEILQIKLKDNFRTPYLATSIEDFWRRWHISLSNWLKDYIYIPLGGNRKGKIRGYLNVIIVFTISGFWHGANYILWGLLHGIFVVLDKIFNNRKVRKIIAIPGTFLLVSILWAFFIWPDTITSLKMIGSLFTTFNYVEMFQNILNLGIDLKNYIILIISVLFIIVISMNRSYFTEKVEKSGVCMKTILLLLLITIVLIFGMYGIGFNVQNFIYSKF